MQCDNHTNLTSSVLNRISRSRAETLFTESFVIQYLTIQSAKYKRISSYKTSPPPSHFAARNMSGQGNWAAVPGPDTQAVVPGSYPPFDTDPVWGDNPNHPAQ